MGPSLNSLAVSTNETKTRVVVADASAVMRRMITQTLEQEPQINLLAVLSNGEELLSRFEQLQPDVIVLDVEMPVRDGLSTLRSLRQMGATIPILMFSSITTKGGDATIQALALGANDYVAKPGRTGHASQALKCLQEELIPKILTWSRSQRKRAVGSGLPRTTTKEVPNVNKRIDLVVIGSSTGGPEALAQIFGKLPIDFPVPILVAQHMPALFTRSLADRLDSLSRLSVREAVEGEVLQAGQIWIAPGDRHLEIQSQGFQKTIRIQDGPRENSCRPSVDVLFRSAAKSNGKHTLAVILTGMGQDGLKGTRSIREAGGSVLVQDAETSCVWGMPRVVFEANLADAAVPIGDLANVIVRTVQHALSTSQV